MHVLTGLPLLDSLLLVFLTTKIVFMQLTLKLSTLDYGELWSATAVWIFPYNAGPHHFPPRRTYHVLYPRFVQLCHGYSTVQDSVRCEVSFTFISKEVVIHCLFD